MRVLAISGSLRKGSTNTAALEALARMAPEDVRVLVYQGLGKLPPFNPDDDADDKVKPEPVEELRAIVGASDAIVIAAPEYAHGVPGVLKNALDWLVASETFAGRKVVLINASPRAYHAQANLREILDHVGAFPRRGVRQPAADRQGDHRRGDRRRPDLRPASRPGHRCAEGGGSARVILRPLRAGALLA